MITVASHLDLEDEEEPSRSPICIVANGTEVGAALGKGVGVGVGEDVGGAMGGGNEFRPSYNRLTTST